MWSSFHVFICYPYVSFDGVSIEMICPLFTELFVFLLSSELLHSLHTSPLQMWVLRECSFSLCLDFPFPNSVFCRDVFKSSRSFICIVSTYWSLISSIKHSFWHINLVRLLLDLSLFLFLFFLFGAMQLFENA